MYTYTKLFLKLVLLTPFSSASSKHSATGELFLTDTGVGHRSLPVPRWRTSLRSLAADGSSPTRLLEFGDPANLEQPVGSTSLTVDQNNKQIYTAISNGIVRSDFEGKNNVTVVTENDTPTGATVHKDKLYWGTEFEGLIKRANLDGSETETLLNVSQGMKYFSATYRQSIRFASSIAIDDESGYLYWSANSNMVAHTDDGSIRRIPLNKANGGEPNEEDVEVLIEGIQMPGQIRLVMGYLYWVHQGRWTNSPTAIRRVEIPTTRIKSPIPTDQQFTIVSSESNADGLFFEQDSSGETMTLSIRSFAVDGRSETLWFALMSDIRTMFGKIACVQIRADGSGEVKVLNKNVTEIGVPVGLEYVS